MRADVLRAAALVTYFVVIFVGTMLTLYGASWVAQVWSGGSDFGHLVRISMGVAVAALVFHSMHIERGGRHGDPESQLG